MSYLIVIAFDDMEQAGKVRASLEKGEKGGYITLDDSAVVIKDEEGKIHIKNEVDQGIKSGVVGGSLLGLLIMGIFAPIGGIIIGALGGGIIGSLTGKGISKNFTKEVADALQPGNSAIFFIVRDTKPDYAIAVLREYKGRVIQTSLPGDVEEELRAEVEKKKKY